MNYKIKALPDFVRTLKRLGKKYHSIKQDYSKLLEELYANPQTGIDLGGGLRKVLWLSSRKAVERAMVPVSLLLRL